MSKKYEKGKPRYEAPRVMRLGALARGQSKACSTGTSAEGSCNPTGNAAELGCNHGNAAENTCNTSGQAAFNVCSAHGHSAVGNCGTGSDGPAPV